MRSKSRTYDAGLIAECRARWFLRLRGFKIIKSRYVTGRNTGRAEIDIIAKRGDLLIFVEVKRRACIEAGWDAITNFQINRLRAAAETYIARNKYHGNARFDVIIVTPRRTYWIRGAI